MRIKWTQVIFIKTENASYEKMAIKQRHDLIFFYLNTNISRKISDNFKNETSKIWSDMLTERNVSEIF